MVNNDDINKEIDVAISEFGSNIPELEKRMVSLLDNLLKELDVKNGKVLANVSNLKVILNINKKLNKIVLNNGYLKNVKGFVKAFDKLSKLQNEYMSQFNGKYSPVKTSDILKQASIDRAIDSLTESGLNASVSKPITDMLTTAITSGGSYSELVQNLRSKLISAEKPSILQRHVNTVAVDSISQFNGANMQLISSDLDIEWYRYSGSNLTTSREFCQLLTEKEWIHKSELGEIIKGNIDGHKCKISLSTGLPMGMMEGTNEDNFMERRGGYNCRHQLIPVHSSIVPMHIRSRFNVGNRLSRIVDDTLYSKKPTGKTIAVGKIDSKLDKYLSRNDINIVQNEILVDDKLVVHSFRDAKSKRGASVSVDEFKSIHKIIEDPYAVFYEKKTGNLIYTNMREDNKMIKIVVKPNYVLKKKGIVNLIVTTGVVQESNMYQKDYKKIK